MKLDRKITIERATTEKNDTGDRVPTWSTLLTAWANVEYVDSRKLGEQYESAQKTAVAERIFTIRYSSNSAGITEKDRISYDSKYFDIRTINKVERNRFIELICDTR